MSSSVGAKKCNHYYDLDIDPAQFSLGVLSFQKAWQENRCSKSNIAVYVLLTLFFSVFFYFEGNGNGQSGMRELFLKSDSDPVDTTQEALIKVCGIMHAVTLIPSAPITAQTILMFFKDLLSKCYPERRRDDLVPLSP